MLVADNYRHDKTFTRATCVEMTSKTLEGSCEFPGVFLFVLFLKINIK